MKITYSKISSMTGDELADIEIQIEKARVNYQKYIDEFNWGMAEGSTSYAERVRKPRMDSAHEILNDLLAQRDQLLKSRGVEQNIDIVKKIVGDTTGNESTSGLPWTTIGLAVGAVVVLVIIIKIV